MKPYLIGLLHVTLTSAVGGVVTVLADSGGVLDWKRIGVGAFIGAVTGLYGWLQKRPAEFWDGSTERRGP